MPPGAPGGDPVTIIIKGDATNYEEVVARCAALLDDLRQKSANIPIGGSLAGAAGGAPTTSSSGVGVAAASTVHTAPSSGRAGSVAPAMPAGVQPVTGAASTPGFSTRPGAGSARAQQILSQISTGGVGPSSLMTDVAASSGTVYGPPSPTYAQQLKQIQLDAMAAAPPQGRAAAAIHTRTLREFHFKNRRDREVAQEDALGSSADVRSYWSRFSDGEEDGSFEDWYNAPTQRFDRFRKTRLGRYGVNLAKGGLVAIGQAGQQEFAASLHERMSGRTDHAGEAGAQGTLIGGLAGAAIGSLFPGYGTIIGASVGGSLGSSIAQYMQADKLRAMEMDKASISFGAIRSAYNADRPAEFGGVAIDVYAPYMNQIVQPYMTNPALARARGMRDYAGGPEGNGNRDYRSGMAGAIARKYWNDSGRIAPNGQMAYDYAMNAEEFASAGNTVYQSLIGGGFNPEASIGGVDVTTATATGRSERRLRVNADGTPQRRKTGRYGWELEGYDAGTTLLPGTTSTTSSTSRSDGTIDTRARQIPAKKPYVDTTPSTLPQVMTDSERRATTRQLSLYDLLNAEEDQEVSQFAPGESLPMHLLRRPDLAMKAMVRGGLRVSIPLMGSGDGGSLVQGPGAAGATSSAAGVAGAPGAPSWHTQGVTTAITNSKGTITTPGSARTNLGYRWAWREQQEDVYDTVPTFDYSTKKGSMPIWKYLTEQTDRYYGTSGKAVMDSVIGPMFGDSKGVGAQEGLGIAGYRGNILDMLLKYGPAATEAYQKVFTPFGQTSPFNLAQGQALIGDLKGDTYASERGSAQIRGSGLAEYSAGMAALTHLGAFPGGKDSLAYDRQRQANTLSELRMYHQTDTLNFDIPMDNLQARRQEHQYLPYQPGYGMAMALEGMSLRAPQIAIQSARFKADMSAGNLSEDQERSARAAILQLKLDQARDLGELAQGGENRITALFAGMPTRRGRFDSLSMARTALFRSGHPRRDLGFESGTHLGQSNAFFDKYGFNIDPLDRMGEANAGYGARGRFAPGGYPGARGGRSAPAAMDHHAGEAGDTGAMPGDFTHVPPMQTSSNAPVVDVLLQMLALMRTRGPGILNPASGSQAVQGRNRAGDQLSLNGRPSDANYGKRG